MSLLTVMNYIMNSNSVKQYFIEHINDKVTVMWPLQNALFPLSVLVCSNDPVM